MVRSKDHVRLYRPEIFNPTYFEMNEELEDDPCGDPNELLQDERAYKIYFVHCIAVLLCLYGAKARDRTGDPRFTKAMLYQLSYFGAGADVRD